MEQGQGAMGMNAMGNNYGGYPSAMTRNGKQGYCLGIYIYIETYCISLLTGLGDPSVGMGGMGGGNSGGFGGSSWWSAAVDFYSFPFSMNPILVKSKIPLLVTNLWFIESKTTII